MTEKPADLSVGYLLSAIANRVLLNGGEAAVEEGFACCHPKNPLRKLHSFDKMLLWSMIVFSQQLREEDTTFLTSLERTAKIAAKAQILAEEMRQDLADGIMWKLFPKLKFPGKVQEDLATYAEVVVKATNLFGKRGHKTRLLKAQYLVTISEFVRHKTASYNDEHLAEFIQVVNADLDDDLKEISGDSIRKKREHLQRKHPEKYRSIVQMSEEIALSEHRFAKPVYFDEEEEME